MNKILIPKNPDESIILPPYVDFRHPNDQDLVADDFLAKLDVAPVQKAYNQIRQHLIETNPDLVKEYAIKQGKTELYDEDGIRTEWIPTCPCTECERSKKAGYAAKSRKQKGQE